MGGGQKDLLSIPFILGVFEKLFRFSRIYEQVEKALISCDRVTAACISLREAPTKRGFLFLCARKGRIHRQDVFQTHMMGRVYYQGHLQKCIVSSAAAKGEKVFDPRPSSN